MQTIATDRRGGRVGVDGEAYRATMAATLERHDGLLVDEATAAPDIGMASSLQRDYTRRDHADRTRHAARYDVRLRWYKQGLVHPRTARPCLPQSPPPTTAIPLWPIPTPWPHS